MALTKRTEIDRREIFADGTIQVRSATVIEEDGIEISRSFRRHVVEPGDDKNKEHPDVKRTMTSEHTPSRVQAYKDKRAAQANG